MKGRCILIGFGLSLFLFGGCATGSKSSGEPRPTPPLVQGQGRIWVYWVGRKWGPRDEFAIDLNYAAIGTARQGSSFYVDRLPGNYLVEAGIIGKTKCYIMLPAGRTVYLRMTPVSHLLGPRGYRLEPVPETTALEELARCEAMVETTSFAEPGGSEELRLILGLNSSEESKVTDCLAELERKHPRDTNAWAEIKPLLRDTRPKVRRKAAIVLGLMHAEVNQENVNDICAMLEASDPGEQKDALRSLRGLDAPHAVPRIFPLLKSTNVGVVRDACRTLAVLGNRSTISFIEPLLSHSNNGVRADAVDAIFQLKTKPTETVPGKRRGKGTFARAFDLFSQASGCT